MFAAWIGVKLALGNVIAVDLGLRRVRRFWPAVGWAVAALVAFYVVALLLPRSSASPTIRRSWTTSRTRTRSRS